MEAEKQVSLIDLPPVERDQEAAKLAVRVRAILVRWGEVSGADVIDKLVEETGAPYNDVWTALGRVAVNIGPSGRISVREQPQRAGRSRI